MLRKNRISRIICAVLVAAAIVALGTVPAYAAADSLDYSRKGSGEAETLNSAQLLSELLGEELPEIESDYLEHSGDIVLRYDNGITSSSVNTDYSAGILRVEALPYTYTAENGAHVTWAPIKATLGEAEVLLTEGNGYTAIFDNVTDSASLTVDITYTATFGIGQSEINSLINKAYTDAAIIKSDFDNRYSAYISAVDAFDAYQRELLAYNAAAELFKAYREEKLLYDEALGEYEAYEEAMELWQVKADAYDAYSEAYNAYQNALAEYIIYDNACKEYERLVPIYEKYLADRETVRRQLAIVESVKVKMTDGRTAYGAITGSTVTSVLENKSLITGSFVGASEDVVNLAGEATESLREIFADFFSYKTEAQRYSYYVNNYEKIRKSFTELLQALDNLYRVKMVRAHLQAEDKDVKYIILVAQLYLVATALNEDTVKSYDGKYSYDGSFTIEDQTPLEILEGKKYLDEVSPIPLTDGYPPDMQEPSLPDAVEPPGEEPDYVAPPGTPPETVAHPGEPPTPVDDPGAPPKEVPPAGEAPTLSQIEAELIEAYELGSLTNREEYTQGSSVTLTHIFKKPIFADKVTATFYNRQNGEIIHEVTVDSGTRVTFSGILPTKAEDISATYSFDGWIDMNGNRVDLSNIASDITLYPSYRTDYKSYPVTWVINGTETEQSVIWGTLPICPISPTKPADSYYEYVFAGWDITPVAVNGAATYTAEFTAVPIASFIGGVAQVSYGGDNYTVDYSTALLPSCNIARAIELAAGNAGLVIEAPAVSVSVPYSSVIALKNAGACSISYIITSAAGEVRYKVSFFDSEGHPIAEACKISASFRDAKIMEGARLFCMEEESRKYVAFTQTADKLSFTAYGGVEYCYTPEYRITVIPSELASITLGADYAMAGDTVTVTVDVPDGVRISKVYYVDSAGNESVITGGAFIAPRGGVRVGVSCYRTEYTVVFADGRNILSTQKLYWGDMPTVPLDPKRASDGEYSYTFIGWSAEINAVTANATYSAEYERTPLPPREEPDGLVISDSVKAALTKAAVVGGAVLIGIVALTAAVIRRRRGY